MKKIKEIKNKIQKPMSKKKIKIEKIQKMRSN